MRLTEGVRKVSSDGREEADPRRREELIGRWCSDHEAEEAGEATGRWTWRSGSGRSREGSL